MELQAEDDFLVGVNVNEFNLLGTDPADVLEVSNNARELFVHEVVPDNNTLLAVHISEVQKDAGNLSMVEYHSLNQREISRYSKDVEWA